MPTREIAGYGAVLTVIAGIFYSGIASAIMVSPVLIDGVLDGNDTYTNSVEMQFANDHHSQYALDDPSNNTTMYWNDHANGLYVYGAVPLKMKNMIWGDVPDEEIALYYQGWCDAPADGQPCTHHNKDGVGGDPSSGSEPLVLDYNRATGSEKFVLAANSVTEGTGKNGEIKINVDGGIKVDLADYPDGVNTQTSVDWVLKNVPDCNKTNCLASDIPMSFEMLFTGADRSTILPWLQSWVAYNNDNSLDRPSALIAHLSPERGGEIPPVPVPAAFWLFGTALLGFIGFSRRTSLS